MKNVLKLIFLGLFAVLALSSCKSYYLNKFCKTFEHIHETSSDSTTEKTTDRETVTKESGEKQSVIITNPCDETGKLKPVKIEKKKGRQNIKVQDQNGALVIECENDSVVSSLREIITDKTREIKELKKTETRTVGNPDPPSRWSKAWDGIKNAFALLGFFVFLWFAIRITARLATFFGFKWQL